MPLLKRRRRKCWRQPQYGAPRCPPPLVALSLGVPLRQASRGANGPHPSAARATRCRWGRLR
eukprot:9686109-Lingulodinium_polyedra.AAC.1